ncbi:aminotransferase class III-fold pyridoxal phosphate-dependent enzyme [Streptomyces griseicoloratus]|uniref:aminotransferase class III-fold pyridoxal phosphate-dependent enzyme n=1 Tax=Streptomyces griseicoloratus TaxID=2752516 RepID=UPI00359CB766
MAESAYGGLAAGEQDPAAARAVPETAPRCRPAREPAARTYARALPIVPVRARGLTIEGADGRRYLDCASGAGTLALGHNHPVVLEAIRKVLDSGAPLQVMDLATPVRDAFVAELLRTLPPGLADRARVRFCGPAGTDAIETAVGLVRAATGRTGTITFAAADPADAAAHAGVDSHADVDVDAGLTGRAVTGPDDARGTPRARLPYPRDYRCPFGLGDQRGAELAARWTESALDDAASDARLPAGMLLEPVQGGGGVAPAPDAWMRRMRQITAERSVPLIVDESDTGVGRTGAFWAVEHSGVTPDVMVLSKAIGGSLPLAVVVHRADLDTGESGAHTAFRGNQLALAAGTATLAHVRENRLAEHAAALGSRILSRLRELAREFPCIGDVRGRGLMAGIELVVPDGDPEPLDERTPADRAAPPARSLHRPGPAAPELAAAVQRECLRRGLIVGLAGRRMNVVRLLPPLTISEEQAAAVLDRLADAVQTVARDHAEQAPSRHRRRPGRDPR